MECRVTLKQLTDEQQIRAAIWNLANSGEASKPKMTWLFMSTAKMKVHRNSLNKVDLLRGQKLDSSEIAFDCFFTKDVIDMIVEITNMERKRVTNDWKDVDDIEIIGLLISAGVERASKRSYVEFYDQLRRPPNFPNDNEFELIQKYIVILPL